MPQVRITGEGQHTPSYPRRARHSFNIGVLARQQGRLMLELCAGSCYAPQKEQVTKGCNSAQSKCVRQSPGLEHALDLISV